MSSRSLLTLTSLLLASAGFLACGRGGPSDKELQGHSGGGDGGTTDGGSSDDTGAGPELGIAGLRGSGEADPRAGVGGYSGAETVYYQTQKGDDLCSVVSTVSSTKLAVPPCKDCTWSFTLTTSDSQLGESAACPDLDPGGFDGASFSYGYFQGDGYGVLAYYYEGYGWYGTAATATWDEGSFDFSYEWPLSDIYLY